MGKPAGMRRHGDLAMQHRQQDLKRAGLDRWAENSLVLLLPIFRRAKDSWVGLDSYTNARTHGTASPAGGLVRMRWSTDADGPRVFWAVLGGPVGAAPTRRGFGWTQIEAAISDAFDGIPRFEAAPVATVGIGEEALRLTHDARFDAASSVRRTSVARRRSTSPNGREPQASRSSPSR